MIRNFSVGAGSIWVRVFGAVWALFDLDFMKDPVMFGKMNGLVLTGGFYFGTLFGEWWVSPEGAKKKLLERLMFALCISIAVAGKRMYIIRNKEKEDAHSKASTKFIDGKT